MVDSAAIAQRMSLCQTACTANESACHQVRLAHDESGGTPSFTLYVWDFVA